MSAPIRRVVTGHKNGKAVVVSDGPPPVVFTNPARPGYSLTQIWMTDASPAPIGNTPDLTERPVTIEPPANGNVIRVIEFPPDSSRTKPLTAEDARAIFARMGSPSAATVRPSSRHPLMHRTETVDYGVVLDGGITLILDEEEVALNVGDVVIQRGTNHAWSNRSDKVCRMLFILSDGHFPEELTREIEAYERSDSTQEA